MKTPDNFHPILLTALKITGFSVHLPKATAVQLVAHRMHPVSLELLVQVLGFISFLLLFLSASGPGGWAGHWLKESMARRLGETQETHVM